MDVREFVRVINSAMKFTADSDAIVTLGMKATRPETGYGYIEADLSMACPSNKEIYRVDAFKEKPDLEVARRYLQRKIISGMLESLYGMSVPLSMRCVFISLRWQKCLNVCFLILYRQGTGDD